MEEFFPFIKSPETCSPEGLRLSGQSQLSTKHPWCLDQMKRLAGLWQRWLHQAHAIFPADAFIIKYQVTGGTFTFMSSSPWKIIKKFSHWEIERIKSHFVATAAACQAAERNADFREVPTGKGTLRACQQAECPAHHTYNYHKQRRMRNKSQRKALALINDRKLIGCNCN